MSTLYMVATPIGNLEDITLRAVRVLKEADVIACEDTRHTGKLLKHFGILTRTISCHAHNEAQSAEGIIKLLREGKTTAYVSDAGTPGISDPGSRLVNAVRAAGYPVVPVPGPSALTALVSAAGYTGKSICFEGFFSPKGGRRRSRLQELLERDEAFVFYESPFRIVKTLRDLSALAPGRRVLVGRELTKLHEEITEGSAEELCISYASRGSVKGEFTVFVSPCEKR